MFSSGNEGAAMGGRRGGGYSRGGNNRGGNKRGGYSRGGYGRGGYGHDSDNGTRSLSQDTRRGYGRPNAAAYWGKKKDPGPRPPAPPLGALIERLKATTLDDDAEDYTTTAHISDVRSVSSYSWMKSDVPTIMIPGMPPRWTPPAVVPRLQNDAGDYFRDVNAAHFPEHPLEPAVVASLDADPLLPSDVDVVACGSTLGNLLRFLRGDRKPFRMLAQVMHGTLFLMRRENSPTELIADCHGYGHTFPEAYTTWDADARGSTSHQRVVRYTFGGLTMLVRFEGDCYVKGDDDAAEGSSVQSIGEPPDLASALDELSMSFSGGSGPASAAQPLRIRRGGRVVSQHSIADIKTRSQRKRELEDTVALELPRFWIRQIAWCLLAYHDRGNFGEVRMISLPDQISEWERAPAQQLPLRRLAALLHRIFDATSKAPQGRMEVVLAETGADSGQSTGSGTGYYPYSSAAEDQEELELELREQTPGLPSALSAATEAKWREGLEEASHASGSSTASESLSLPSEVNTKSRAGKEAPKSSESELLSLVNWDDAGEDYTGCSKDCGYCGQCSY